MEENKKGKKSIVVFIVIAILAIALIITGVILWINSNKPKSNVQITSAEDMENLINTVYEGVSAELPPTLMTQTIDISNVDILRSYTGLTSNENIDAVVVSEPMIGAQAYSFVLVKVKDGQDADAVAKAMSENVDTRKWICVEADNLYATSVDNLAVLVMADAEWATPVYNKLKEVLGANNEEYVKENTEGTFEDQGLIEDQGIFEDQGIIDENTDINNSNGTNQNAISSEVVNDEIGQNQ